MTEPLVFAHGAASDAFYAVLALWVLFEGGMNLRQRWRARGGRWTDPTAFFLVLCIGAALAGSLREGRADPLPWPGGRVWPVVAGLVLAVLGIALRAWSIAALGRFFQYQIQIQSGHQVVTSGPYRYVRHPSYTGIGLVIVGIALATGDVVSLLIAVVLPALGLVARIRAEERQLTKALGEEYERFAAGRKRLLPGVW
jgi:protein-S-isoprenylcysteine O-methyltransferase Ste14